MHENQQPRILISRLSHIGDCILTIPVANAIRDSFPNAFIAWAIEAPGDRLIQECAAVDRVIKVPKGWLKKPLQTWRLRKSLRAEKFDFAVDPQSLTKSAGISYISGARKRVGLSKPLGRELAPWLNNVRVQVESRHVVDRSIEMLSGLGIRNPQTRFDLTIPAAAQSFAENWRQQTPGADQFVVVNPGAGWASRQWSNARFGEVAAYLQQAQGLLPVITWFGDAEEKMADEIVEFSGGLALKAPSTRLWELGALINQSRFYIGCDTGPTHLAAALKVPCITLFGTTEPEVSGPYEFDRQHPIHVYVQKYYQAGTSRERRKAENEAMMEISVADACAAVDRMCLRLNQMSAA